MNYTPAQVEKLLLERDWMRNQPHCQELAERDAELRQVMVTDSETYYAAVTTVYQESA